MSEIQGDKLIEEQQLRIKELDNIIIKYGEDKEEPLKDLQLIKRFIRKKYGKA